MGKLVDDLVVHARNTIKTVIVRVRGIGLPDPRSRLTGLRPAARRLLDGIGTLTILRESFTAARGGLGGHADRLRALRWRLRTTRLGRSADGLLVLPLLGLALVLGVVAATAASKSSSPTGERAALPTIDSGTSGEVITETVVRDGETVRVVRFRKKPGHVVIETIKRRSVTTPGRSVTIPGDAVTLPGHTDTDTIVKTKTETVTNMVTVTNVVTETQVVVSTETVFVEPPPPPDGG